MKFELEFLEPCAVIARPLLPRKVKTAQNAAMKWIALKLSSQTYFTINDGDAGDAAPSC
jgi:hypothetical protein